MKPSVPKGTLSLRAKPLGRDAVPKDACAPSRYTGHLRSGILLEQDKQTNSVWRMLYPPFERLGIRQAEDRCLMQDDSNDGVNGGRGMAR